MYLVPTVLVGTVLYCMTPVLVPVPVLPTHHGQGDPSVPLQHRLAVGQLVVGHHFRELLKKTEKQLPVCSQTGLRIHIRSWLDPQKNQGPNQTKVIRKLQQQK